LETHRPTFLEAKLEFLDEDKELPFTTIQEKMECAETVPKLY
jgi:hypothetical protein